MVLIWFSGNLANLVSEVVKIISGMGDLLVLRKQNKCNCRQNDLLNCNVCDIVTMLDINSGFSLINSFPKVFRKSKI